MSISREVTAAVRHPGSRQAERLSVGMGIHPARLLIGIPPGASIQDGIAGALAFCGAHTATFELLSGDLSEVTYHLAAPQRNSPRASEYGSPIKVIGATLIHASGSCGRSIDNTLHLHVHAAFADRSGEVRLGHLNPSLCTVGRRKVTALLTVSSGFSQRTDTETGFSLFFPYSE